MFSKFDLELLLFSVRAEIKHIERNIRNLIKKGTISVPSKIRFREKRLQSIRSQLERMLSESIEKG
jgi:hypothetical protein